MIGVVATIRVQDGKSEELEQVFRELTPQVRANEAGCLIYQLTKSRTEPNTYKVLELYNSEDALKQHGQSDHFKAIGPRLGACLVGRAEVERLDGVL